jgi:hypothetical protein
MVAWFSVGGAGDIPVAGIVVVVGEGTGPGHEIAAALAGSGQIEVSQDGSRPANAAQSTVGGGDGTTVPVDPWVEGPFDTAVVGPLDGTAGRSGAGTSGIGSTGSPTPWFRSAMAAAEPISG